MTSILLVVAAFVAWTNGANDNPKGVATLIGSRTTDQRTAIVWATVTTLLGSLTAIVVGIATTALGLAVVVRIREEYGSVEEDKIKEVDADT